jgi:2-C-methyl-D-erythritol 4-phosphate cytidylyltransferase / 2-C-methyl-D-erythritol 2,4-cyclodiphosphate synthase
MTNTALLLAAGSGSRAGSALAKQYQLIAGKPLLRHTLEAFSRHPKVDAVRVVIAAGDEARFKAVASDLDTTPVIGGATRQESGRLGLESLAGTPPRNVLIHDAARPFVSASLIDKVLAGLERHQGAIPAMPVTETLKRAPAGLIAGTVDREGLWSAQTPQGFRYGSICEAHSRAAAAGLAHFTDDAAVAEWAGIAVAVVEGEPANVKVTTSEDLRAADQRLTRDRLQHCPDMRVGQGYDVHAYEPGDRVVLCGIAIPHHARLAGHSDADAPMHALTDALLGSIGESDIGTHFPPSDMQWKNAASAIFLRHAAGLIEKRGGFIANADITIICEAPRIAPHIPAMRANLSEILKLSPDRVGIKATTSEALGFIGRGEGLEAFAIAAVRLP